MEKDRIDYRNIRTLISPSNLFSMGCRAIASYNPSFGFIYRTVEFLKGFIKRRKTTD